MNQDYDYLPKFKHIDLKSFTQDLNAILVDNRQQISELLSAKQPHTWESLMQPLEEMNDRIQRLWGPLSHMHSVVDSDELRKVYQACLQPLSDYGTELGQNQALYHAISALRASGEDLDAAQRKHLDDDVRDFQLAGVALAEDKQQQFKSLKARLSELTTEFEQNVLDSTQAWTLLIKDAAGLAGMPPHALAAAKQAAEAENKQGYLLNLEFPCYYAVISYADDRELRRQCYYAYSTRASDQGPNAGQWDNSEVIEDILAIRHQLAQLLGYAHYADYSLATKMADNSQQVIDFLYDLAQRSRPQALAEYKALQEYAREHHAIEQLEPWDIAYYSEKLRQHRYAISQEDLRPYFPETKVLPGMFAVVKQLYGLRVEVVEGIETWHTDVRFYNIYDENDELRGQLYIDLYARKHKRGGAWMDECMVRRRLMDGSIQCPVAYLNCNFAGPSAGQPALFSHDEVETLFHEFGHCLHHLLTQMEYAGVSGINGVPWDAVELPSQFFENWCWHRQSLDIISAHYQSGEPLPDELFNKMLAAKHFQSAMLMIRQLEFSLFDFILHSQPHPGELDMPTVLAKVRAEVSVVPVAEFNRFAHSFSHIFAGGYAAGYYSYKWAEVLSSDAFSRFEEEGIFNRQTGRDFMQHILEKGGSAEPAELFKAFRGREPSIDALLRHNGIGVE